MADADIDAVTMREPSRLQVAALAALLLCVGGAADCLAKPMGDGVPATSAWLLSPQGIGLAPDGGLYIADTGHHTIRRVDPEDGTISTVVGYAYDHGESAGPTPARLAQGGGPHVCNGYEGDGQPATEALFDNVQSVSVGIDGSFFVAAAGNHVIRWVDRNGYVLTVAGTGEPGYTAAAVPGTDGSAVAVPGTDGSAVVAYAAA